MLLQWGIVLLAPLFMPLGVGFLGYCVVGAYREQQSLERSARTFRAYEFVEVNKLHLDDWVREHFELHTPPLVRLGYDLIGDYRLKPEPIEVYDRFFLSGGGETLASICALLDTSAVCLISVLENGTSVNTCASEDPHPDDLCKPQDQVWTTFLPDASIEDLHYQHQQVLQERCVGEGTRVLRLRKEQFREVVTYDQRIQCRWRFRNGRMDQDPPAPDFATLLAPPATPQVSANA
jgi:hypothetical protein